MPDIILNDELRREYGNLFITCVIAPNKAKLVQDVIDNILSNRTRYQDLGNSLGIPWYLPSVIHNCESNLNFKTHLHNGDPLTARTVQFPPGRPKDGQPPFTWEFSAEDALRLQGLDRWKDWTLAGTLYQLERYNGWGYRLYRPHVLSAYLWSFSNHYHGGTYVGDGRWSDTAVWQNCGGAVILRRMAELNLITFPDKPGSVETITPAPDSSPLVSRHSMFLSNELGVVRRAEELQRWLNTFDGIFVKVDGIPGDRTSEAYRKVSGHYLPGDPRCKS